MAQEESIDRLLPLLQQVFAEQDGLRRFLEAVAQQAMSSEVRERLNAGRHERTEARSGYRNGSKPRRPDNGSPTFFGTASDRPFSPHGWLRPIGVLLDLFPQQLLRRRHSMPGGGALGIRRPTFTRMSLLSAPAHVEDSDLSRDGGRIEHLEPHT